MFNGNGVSTSEKIEGRIDQVVDGIKQASARATIYGAKLTKAIREHPYAALGIALGCGFLFTKWLRK